MLLLCFHICDIMGRLDWTYKQVLLLPRSELPCIPNSSIGQFDSWPIFVFCLLQVWPAVANPDCVLLAPAALAKLGPDEASYAAQLAQVLLLPVSSCSLRGLQPFVHLAHILFCQVADSPRAPCSRHGCFRL